MEQITQLEVIRDWLRNFAEGMKAEMSVNVYNDIWDMIQSIDKQLEVKKWKL